MPSLILQNNSSSNPLTLDLSQYLDLTTESDMDPYDPAFRTALISHSLLKEGGVLSLEDLKAKELVFPLLLSAANSSALAQLIQTLNQIVTSQGATFAWQDDGMSQPTVFDGISGQFDVKYKYRESASPGHLCRGELRLFTLPFPHTAAPRTYAVASGVGPVLMISPYASTGQLAIGPSATGFGGSPGTFGPNGPSGGVSYPGNPSLAGDAPALLEISYVGPLPNGASNTGVVPYAAVSLLPDQNYQPLVTAPEIAFLNLSGATALRKAQTSVASQYVSLATGASLAVADIYSFQPLSSPSAAGLEPTAGWTGQHRLLAIARASSGNLAGGISATLNALPGPLVQPGQPTVQIQNPGCDWQLYDLGTFALRASEYPQSSVQVEASLTAGASAALDLGALVMLPDNNTWFLNPNQIQPSQYGFPANLASQWGAATGAYTNTLLLHDVVADQFLYSGQSQTFAPSPVSAVPSSSRITHYSRGLVPRPDPKNGLPILAIVGVGQPIDPAITFSAALNNNSFGPGAPGTASSNPAVGSVAWTNPNNIKALDQVYATSALSAGWTSDYLEATNFGFNIPAAATIVGIQAQIVRHAGPPSNTLIDATVSLVKAGAVQATNKASGAAWATGPDQTASYGGPADMWGNTWAPADINASGFGLVLAVQSTGSGITAYVDYVTLTVYFTLGTAKSFNGASQANPQNLQTMAQVSVLERTRYVLS